MGSSQLQADWVIGSVLTFETRGESLEDSAFQNSEMREKLTEETVWLDVEPSRMNESTLVTVLIALGVLLLIWVILPTFRGKKMTVRQR